MAAQVSVVIPTYNRPGPLRRAVDSALAQERVDVEVIVVDDGSSAALAPDGLPEEVLVDRTTGAGGVAAARNLGAQRARGPWIAFLDDDDWWAPDHLHRLLGAADRSGAGFAYAATWNVDVARGRAALRPAPAREGLAAHLLRENAIGTPSCLMVRRSLYTRVGGFDPKLSVVADWDLWIRLAGAADAAVSPAATVAYAAHDDNMSLDLPRLLREFKLLAARYAEPCRRANIRFGDPGFAHWIAELHRRQGHRRLAAAWYLRSARVSGRRLDALRAVGMLAGEPVMRLGSRTVAPDHTPPGWLCGSTLPQTRPGPDLGAALGRGGI